MLAELLDTQEEQSPLEMAQKVALMYRDKEEVIEEIDLLVADTLTMTTDERCVVRSRGFVHVRLSVLRPLAPVPCLPPFVLGYMAEMHEFCSVSGFSQAPKDSNQQGQRNVPWISTKKRPSGGGCLSS